jgi:rod shape-determining protein MreC
LKRQNWVIIGLLVVGWIIFLGQPTRVSTKLRMIFVQLTTPFVKLGDSIPAVHSRRQLAAQNDSLRAENENLRQQVRSLSEAGRENLRLQQLLALKDRPTRPTLGARVIGRDASNWWRSIQIDRGTQDGVRENLAVINTEGLVGKVVSATKGEARVLLLIDPDCKASALLQDTREPGVVAGSESVFSREPFCVMTYVNRAAKTKPGELVVTSGLGGIFPKGILIGTVVSAGLNKQTGMFQDVRIKPAVDFRRLEEVLVMTE